MEKSYSTRYITASGRGDSDLKTFSGRLAVGAPLVIDGEEDVLLAGGFARLSPQTGFTLSPTLQLQADLTEINDEELLRLALAEKERAEAVRFHSYGVEADLRVAVLAADSSLLEAFCDTYGGLLDLRPVLVPGGAGTSEVVDYALEKTKDGLRLRYSRRAPVDRERCSYCGDCGLSCAEGCLGPDLKIDYSRCTFCRACEQACVRGAVDIHAVEEVTLEVPACILLGELRLDDAEELPGVYRADELESYFQTVYDAEIEEVVCHNNSLCQYSGRLDAGCGRCIDSCPAGAIGKDARGIRIDHLRCRECGACIAACPTGAMQNGRFEDGSLLRYLQRLGGGRGRKLVLGSEEELLELWWQERGRKRQDVFYLEYPLAEALSAFHLLLLGAAGFTGIILLAGAESPLARPVRQANQVFSSLHPGETLAWLGTPGDCQQLLAGIASGEAGPSLLPEALANRRTAYVEVLGHLLNEADGVTSLAVPEGEFAQLNIREQGCTQCLACLGECKVGALQADEEKMLLGHTPSQCVGCGICVHVCPEKVLSLAAVASIEAGYFKSHPLSKAEPAVCKRCGAVFGTRSSLEKVMAILAAREPVNREHFEYCSTCRVVNLFEAETT